jgi:SAM-dependent methyltransferase
MSLRNVARRVPGAQRAVVAWRRRNLTSAGYWEQNYATGLTSGSGSYGRLADFKAEVLNEFVATANVQSVVELGCGDGNQLSLAQYPSYTGLDVAASAVELCRTRFADDPTKTFRQHVPGTDAGVRAELALSLDVIFHLLEDEAFEDYMRTLFSLSERYIVIYSSDFDEPSTDWWEVRHRQFSKWIAANAPGWSLTKRIPQRYPFDPNRTQDTAWCDFFFYERAATV